MFSKNKIRTMLVLLMVSVLAFSCKKSNEVEVRELNPETDTEILDEIIASGDEGIPFPQGSKVRIDQNGMHIITLPEGYFYLVAPTNERVQPIETPVIGVNCNCTEGTGCDPAYYDGKYYCVMKSGCLNCKRTNLYENQRGEAIEVEVLGLLNRNVGISLLCDEHVEVAKDQILKPNIMGIEVIHGNAFEELFNLEDVKKEFEMLGTSYEEAGTPPNTLAFMNIFGNVALVPFYIEEGQCIYAYGNNAYYAKTVPPGSGDEPVLVCRCQSGDNGCTLEKHWIPILGTAYRCVSNGCSSCTMLSIAEE